jgi:two-component system cell cycle response regulator DivK
MSGELILIIEDNPINMQLATALLKRRGYEVLGAADADEALKVLQDNHPVLILMDIQLPGMDGLQLTKLLKQNPRTQNIIIIALTAYAMKEDQQKTIDAGCDAYVTKPFDTKELPALIESLIRSR